MTESYFMFRRIPEKNKNQKKKKKKTPKNRKKTLLYMFFFISNTKLEAEFHSK